MKKKLLMRLAAAALAVGMCLSSAGASYLQMYHLMRGIMTLLQSVRITVC